MSYFPQPGPYVLPVKAGKKYYWCQCGRSQSQPLCDGAHKGSEASPVLFEANKDRYVYFCGCKKTKTPPFCDGSHRAE